MGRDARRIFDLVARTYSRIVAGFIGKSKSLKLEKVLFIESEFVILPLL